ncbi:lytic transglycosylase domain-containing protein [Neokomagataea tanensis]|nr:MULTISPECIES: lytic transglycosylase domain-containing protein [Neokomagataea]
MANPAYRAPGSAADPWGPYIREASNRSTVPESWIRAVMHQESGGHEYLDGQPITSSSGAMGLMQLMPQTYADMQDRLNLGSDPYEPHDNIAAGSEYIAILSRKYGSPAFLAAYNAGPQRLEAYLNQGRPLPHETVAYVAAITPHLGDTPPAATSSASYSSASSIQAAWANRNYTAVPQPSVAAPTRLSAPVSSVPCDPDAAYDTADNCSMPTSTTLAPPSPTPTSQALPAPPTWLPPPQNDRAPNTSTAAPVSAPPSHYGNWSVQVGAFNNAGQARFAATMARQASFSLLQATQTVLQPVVINGRTLWRSRLVGLDSHSASSACRQLNAQGLACIAKPPGQ